ncbi:hypothetical protein [Staphylococcus sp. GDX8P80P]|uniref:spr1630 family ClpXP-sensitive toxin n=1 Tax=Staphylococcus sp. GDX8P80P TaxID=2804104 RepID=UPI001AEBB44C|nr:hypothetical protein [Staphylococcus sp. GDX8P80P]
MNEYVKGLKTSILEGIVHGYKDYIKVRTEAYRTMEISEAYAYTKSNHIEHQVATHIKEYMDFQKSNAGPSWKYLKFIGSGLSDNQYLSFIIKNEKYFNNNAVTYGKTPFNNKDEKEKVYLKELVSKNQNIDFDKLQNEHKHPHQLNWDDYLTKPNIYQTEQKSDGIFNIITYNIDSNTKMIDSVKICIPNPVNNKAIMIEDLSDEVIRIIANEQEYLTESDDFKEFQTINDSDIQTVDPEKEFGFIFEQEEQEKFN